jgi:molybdopterin/thiamine biosynthesis adenylyltransferase
MNDQQLLRYSRHILLDEIGIEGQQRIAAASVLIIGAGGLGSPAAMYLAASGVGRIVLADDDAVDLTNLQRQIAHTTARVGQAKVTSARDAMLALNPDIEVVALAERVQGTRLMALVAEASVVLDCCDNFATRHAVNRACVAQQVPLVSGAAIRFDGQVSVFDTRAPGCPGCYNCLFPEGQGFTDVACSSMGVFAPLVGVIGAMQAAEALKLILGMPSPAGRLLLLDGRNMEWTSIQYKADPACPVCVRSAESGLQKN